MASILLIAATLLLALFAPYPYRLLRNYYYARRTNLPYVVIPLDQNATIWMAMSVVLRPLIRKWLPQWIVDRVMITIYGWEYHEGSKPFETWAKPMGDEKTLAWVTCGSFEVNSWDSEVVMDVLKRPKDFHEPVFNTLFIGRFGHNVLTTNGEHWARQRKIIAQVVNERISKVVFNETIRQTAGMLDEVLEHGTKSSAETYSAFDMMKKITIHVLSGAGMGQDVSWAGQNDLPAQGFEMTYMNAAKVIMDGVAGPIILPSWFLDNYPSFLPGHNFLKRLGCAVREYPLHTKAMLDAERERVKEEDTDAKVNIVNQLVQASRGALTEDEMVGNLFIFTAAGFDTTANTLSYALATLVQQPKWQSWIFDEIDAILPEDQDAELDYADTYPKAIRIMALMLETLRLFSPLVHIAKAAHGEQTVTTSKHVYRLPHNTLVYIDSVALHRDPAIWRDLNQSKDKSERSTGEPDEHVFRPTRWIISKDGEQTLFQPPKGTYVPWSAGPRNCPGMKMAQVEFTAAILTLFRKHRLDAVPLQLGTRLETETEITQRITARIKDSISILTLQMNGVYDTTKPDGQSQSIKIRISKR